MPAPIFVPRRWWRRPDSSDAWAFAPSRSTVFFTSTKFPRARPRERPRRGADAQTARPALADRRAPSRERNVDRPRRRHPRATSRRMLPVRIWQRAPMRVLPRSCTPGSITVSGPATTRDRSHRFRQINRHARVHHLRGLRARNTRSTSARSVRVLQPRTSSASAQAARARVRCVAAAARWHR